MDIYEHYILVSSSNDHRVIIKDLNNMGKQGWQLVCVEKNNDEFLGENRIYYFKRLKKL